MYALQIYEGPVGTCPDCGEPTFVRRVSLLNTVRLVTWEPSNHLLYDLSRSLVRTFRYPLVRKKRPYEQTTYHSKKALTCSRCAHKVVQMLWMEPEEGAVLGPFCKECLRYLFNEMGGDHGPKDDIPAYVAPANKTTLLAARTILLLRSPDARPDPKLRDRDVVLF